MRGERRSSETRLLTKSHAPIGLLGFVTYPLQVRVRSDTRPFDVLCDRGVAETGVKNMHITYQNTTLGGTTTP